MFQRQYFAENYFSFVFWSQNGAGAEFDGSAMVSIHPEGNHMLKVHKIQVDWVTGSSGTIEIPTPVAYGFLLKIVTVPSESLSPSLGYNIDLLGEDSVDIMSGAAHGLDSVNTEQIYPTMNDSKTPVMVTGEHTLRVSNAGSGKAGRAKLYFVETLGKKNVA